MFTYSLNGTWKMKMDDREAWIPARVPGSAVRALFEAGMIGDPFYRENEREARDVARHGCVFERGFEVSRDLMRMDRIILRCEGLDTVTDISVNGKPAGHTENMHRTYEFEVKSLLIEGKNIISILIHSPIQYIEEKDKQNDGTWGADVGPMKGFQHIRKAHCMFGWDWGPQIPDMGIWRDIALNGYDAARLADVRVSQKHRDGAVDVCVDAALDRWAGEGLTLRAVLTHPDGAQTVMSCLVDKASGLGIPVERPTLWWPNGYGAQPLYDLTVTLLRNDTELDSRQFRLGLRTMEVRQEPDEWGKSFEFCVNGVSIFAMGADYIPEDAILSRCSPERTEKLIQDCVEAHFNCLRVWGGGYYPDDWFYDLCDQYGLVIWQDMLFACATYRLTPEFTEEIVAEARDNIRRIRHHASLGLWCGNNEMEWGWLDWDFPKPDDLRADYVKQFEVILPEIAHREHPEGFYWPASPSSGGGFDDPNGEDRGDSHYWAVWHGSLPFSAYLKHYHRFMSEFGFQSLSDIRTIESYTLPEDRNYTSPVMENHQKQPEGNGKILNYISQLLPLPSSLPDLVYASQVVQAEAIRQGVEHWRRNRGRCMGAIYWQLNDDWPVTSWASIDYYGCWKALHYAAVRFFAPVLASAAADGTKVSLHVANETMDAFAGELVWRLRDNGTAVLLESRATVSVPKLSSKMISGLDFGAELGTIEAQRSHWLEFELLSGGNSVSRGVCMFAPPKHFSFLDPKIHLSVSESEQDFEVEMVACAFAMYATLSLDGHDAHFSDNYISLVPGMPARVKAAKASLSDPGMTKEQFERSLRCRSVHGIAK